MTIQQENALIRRALLEAAAADFAGEAEEVPMSPRQFKRMRAMTADPFGYARRVRRSWWRKAAHTAAMAALAVGLSIEVLAAASPTVRAAIKQWFMEVRQRDIVYHFTGEPEEKELPCYTIAELPEGYAYTKERFEDVSRRIQYENAQGQRITLEYMFMESGSVFWISTRDMDVRDITVNGHSGQLFLSQDEAQSSGVLWVDEEANLQFYVDAFADEAVLLHMAESVSLCKTEKP